MPRTKKLGVGEDAVGEVKVGLDPVPQPIPEPIDPPEADPSAEPNLIEIDEAGNEWIVTPDGTRFQM
jgi:hypothetical protein